MPLAKPVQRSRSDRTGHETTDCFKIGKGVCQGCTLSPCLFNLHAEYIMGNTGIDKAQAGIKIAKRNINNLKYAGLATERETKDLFAGIQLKGAVTSDETKTDMPLRVWESLAEV